MKIFKSQAFFLFILAFVFFSGVTYADQNLNSPEEYIQSIGDRTLGILKREDFNSIEKIDQISKIFTDNLSVKRIAYFVLGPYRKNLSPIESERYISLVKRFISEIYAKRLLSYPRGIMNVNNSKDRGKLGIIINSSITFADNPNPIRIDWWVIENNRGQLKVFDIRVSGVWMAQEQRSTFTAFLSKNNGSINKLMQRMEVQLK